MRSVVLCGLFLVAVAATGCGEKPKSRIHGTIKFQGKPLTEATIIFLASDNTTYTAELLKGDGTYEVTGVTRGTIQVSIQQALPSVSPRADPTGKIAAAKAAKVGDEKGLPPQTAPPPSTPRERKIQFPAKYNDPKQSGLTFELKDADQEWSVNLD